MSQNVAEKVGDNLGDLVFVCHDDDVVGLPAVQTNQRRFSREIARVHIGQGVVADSRNVHCVALKDLALVEAGELEKVFHQAAHTAGFGFDTFHRGRDLLLWNPAKTVQLGISTHGGQRGA